MVYLRDLSANNIFIFLFFIFGDIFGAPITLERYHFQSGYNPDIEQWMFFKVNL